MSDKKETFQFTPAIGDLQKGEAPVGAPIPLPEHLQKAEFLSPETMSQLAGLEEAAKKNHPSKGPQGVGPAPLPTSSPPAPPAPPAEAKGTSDGGDDADDADDDFSNELPPLPDFRNNELLEDYALRRAIESRCKPMTIDQLLVDGHSTQIVPIVPDKFEVSYTTTSGDQDLYVKRALDKERGNDVYLHQLLTLMNLAMGLSSLNGTKYPVVVGPDGVDEEAFKAKLKAIKSYPVPMLLSLQINYFWFFERAKKLFSFQ